MVTVFISGDKYLSTLGIIVVKLLVRHNAIVLDDLVELGSTLLSYVLLVDGGSLIDADPVSGVWDRWLRLLRRRYIIVKVLHLDLGRGYDLFIAPLHCLSIKVNIVLLVHHSSHLQHPLVFLLVLKSVFLLINKLGGVNMVALDV